MMFVFSFSLRRGWCIYVEEREERITPLDFRGCGCEWAEMGTWNRESMDSSGLYFSPGLFEVPSPLSDEDRGTLEGSLFVRYISIEDYL